MKTRLGYLASLFVSVALLQVPLASAQQGDPVTRSDTVRAQQADTLELGKTWSEGDAMEEKGAKIIARGEKLILNGEKKIAKGKGLVRTGTDKAELQKANYACMVRTMGVARAPKQLKKELKTMSAIAEKWDHGVDAAKRGEKLIKDGEKEITEGRAKLRKGNSMVLRGQGQKNAVETQIQSEDAKTRVEIEDLDPVIKNQSGR
ncbi:MAG: hypothetical protein AAFY83_12475 [Pseudomonadota bacterium]